MIKDKSGKRGRRRSTCYWKIDFIYKNLIRDTSRINNFIKYSLISVLNLNVCVSIIDSYSAKKQIIDYQLLHRFFQCILNSLCFDSHNKKRKKKGFVSIITHTHIYIYIYIYLQLFIIKKKKEPSTT